MQAGIEEDYVDAWHDSRRYVGKHGVGERARHTEPGPERLDRPADDLLGGRVLQLDRGARRQVGEALLGTDRCRGHRSTSKATVDSPSSFTEKTRAQERHSQAPWAAGRSRSAPV